MASSKDIQIPVIDIANPTDELAEQLLDAAATYGFVFVELEGTNITVQDVNRMFELVSITYEVRRYVALNEC